jgi:hypothetical protein
MENKPYSLKTFLGVFSFMGLLAFTFALNATGLIDLRTLYANVTGVDTATLVDNDAAGAANFGLDGRDITVTWTAATLTNATTFQQYKIYIVQNAATAPTTETVGDYTPVVQNLTQMAQTSWTGPMSLTMDSGGGSGVPAAALATGQYKACVLAVGSDNSKITCSAAATLTSDSVTDTKAPFIMHVPVFKATESVDAIIHASIFDEQVTESQFNNTGDGGAEYFKLYYGSTLSSSVDAVQVTGKLFKFTVPSASVPAAAAGDPTFKYYVTAKDRNNNISYFCANPNAASAANCEASPFVVTTVVAGSRSIAGTISSGGAALGSAQVIIGGYAKAASATDGSGNYSITGLPNNSGFDIMAFKSGYCENGRFENVGTSNLTGINFNLNAGTCTASGQGGGKPHVMFSGPPEFANSVPLGEKMRVGFDQALNPATVNDTDPTNAGSNVYLTTNGSDRIAGSVVYCANSSSPGCSSLFSADQKVILFSPSSNLTASTFYTLVITEGVTSETGQSIEGNRPGGGHQIGFTTGGGTIAFNVNNFGTGGAFMPPFVQSTIPAPGIAAAPNTKIVLTFNEAMGSATLTTNNIKLVTGAGNPVSSSIAVDNNTNKVVTITPSSSLSTGEYEVRVLGAVANASGVTMRPPDQASSVAFSTRFNVSGSNDSTAPTIYPLTSNNATGIPVNQGFLEYGFSEPIDASTITTTNIVVKRGTTVVPANVRYEPGVNSVYVTPNNVLAQNTVYSVTFGTAITDLAGQALASAQTYSFTTGSADTTAPNLKEVRCDDYSCFVSFSEPMNNKTQADGSDFDNSVIKKGNFILKLETSPGSGTFGADVLAGASGTTLVYDPAKFSVEINGNGLTAGDRTKKFELTVNSATKDLSANAINTGSSANVYKGTVEDSTKTFGTFGSTGGMFGPPQNFFGTGGTGAGEFKPQGFGSFTAEQFAFGAADQAFPFNPMASQDSNVFQIRFNPGVAVQNGDQVVLTFPNGTGLTNAAADTFSPFFKDINEFAPGTIAFDTSFDTDGVAVDTTAKTVTIKMAVSGGSPGANDSFTFDLRKITNPSIPKGPDTGGYTVDIKLKRSGSVLANKTSMPYFINAGGTNNITVKVYAGSSGSPVNGANGSVFMFGGGPGGPLNKNLTLTNGVVTAADGTAIGGDAGVQYTNLPNGCYFFNTDPSVSLGGIDYIGKHSPEPVCVTGGQSTSKNIILSSAEAGGASVPLTVKFSGIADFGGVDIDVFAGGPNNFVVKTLTAVGAPNAGGYTLRLPANGHWFVGVGPAMPKGSSGTAGPLKQLPAVPPPPVDLVVSGLGGTPSIATGFQVPPGVGFNPATNTLTISFSAADKTISGTVTDGTTPLANIEIFVHSQGFGAPTFAKTKSDGTFSLNVSDYGSYEIGASKDGMPPRFDHIELKPDGSDAGSDPDLFFKGKQITGSNPFVIKLKKASYTISGKVLDASNNGIAYAPVFANDENGNSVGGGTSADGSYTLFVDAGTWTVKSQLPPDKTDACGSFSKTVTVTNENKSSQNITPTTGTCYTLSGTVTVGGTAKANVPVFVEEWNTGTDRPAGGLFKPSSTNSSGVYEVKVAGNKTYRIGTWDADYGELSVTQAVVTSDITNAHLNSGATGTVTFAFTGGTSSMEAFVEIKKSNDKFTRLSKSQKGLNSNLAFTVKEGTYDYSINVFGVGNFSGTVATGSTATINLSSSNLVTLSGNVKDTNGNTLAGALVAAKDTTTGLVQTAKTDDNGNYEMKVKTGTYSINESLAGYVPDEAPQTVNITANKSHNFGPTGEQLGLEKADDVITGTIFQSNGSTPATEGFVSASNASGLVVTAPIDPQNGTYSLPVTDGSWTVKAVAPLAAKTTKSGTVTMAGSDVSGQNITLTADSSKTSTTNSKAVAANTGGSINDTNNTGIKLTTGAGVLETGSGNVTVNVEKTFTAPDTGTFKPLGDAAFGISATGSSTIKNLNGNAEIQIDYSNLVASLPSGVTESDLKMAYFSPELGEYVPVEGGFNVDATNNTVTGQVNHLTDFVLVYSTPAPASSSPSPSPNPSPSPASGSSGGSVGFSAPAQKSVATTTTSESEDESTKTTESTKSISPTTKPVEFKDVKGHWAKDYISDLTQRGVVKGYDKDNFAPNQPITRAEFTKIALTAFGIQTETPATSPFKDVKTSEWHAPYVYTAMKKGIITGYQDKTFRSHVPINRAEALKILFTAAGIDSNTEYKANFPDISSKAWYARYINYAAKNGIINGYADGTFGPNNNLTRGEVAKIVSLLLKKNLKQSPASGL